MKKYIKLIAMIVTSIFLVQALYNVENIYASGKTVKIEEEIVTEDSHIFSSSLNIPIIRLGNNTYAEEKINNMFREDAYSFMKDIKAQAERDYQNSSMYNMQFIHKYIANTSYKVRYAKKNILSITVIYDLYTGGAHGLEIQRGYTFNLKTGDIITLKELFHKGFDYDKVIKSSILEDIRKNPGDYFPIDTTSIQNVPWDERFYLEEDNLVIHFGAYEIAPYAAGLPEFRIPFSKLKFHSKKLLK
jgi:hypothetical protein